MMSNAEEINGIAVEFATHSPYSFVNALEYVTSYIHKAMCLGNSFDQSKQYFEKGVPIEVLILGYSNQHRGVSIEQISG